MFISQAFAQDAAGGTSALGSGLEMLFLFAPLMVVWYFPHPSAARTDEEAPGNADQYSPR